MPRRTSIFAIALAMLAPHAPGQDKPVRTLLINTPDASTRTTLIQDRLALWNQLSQPRPESRERIAPSPAADDTALIRAIRQQSTAVLAGFG